MIQLKAAPGATFSIDELKQAVKEHKPAILFLVQVGVRWQMGVLHRPPKRARAPAALPTDVLHELSWTRHTSDQLTWLFQ